MMPRLLPAALLAALLATSPRAQDATPHGSAPGSAPGSAHALPFGSSGHEVALALGLPGGAAGDAGWAVTVEAAPAWVVVTRREAMAELPPGTPGQAESSAQSSTQKAESAAEPSGEPVARVRFDLAPGAPVGQPGVIRLAVRDAAGAVVAHKDVVVVVEAPSALALGAPRPNPSRGAVRVPYRLPAAGHARVRVVDVLGRTVARLADGAAAPGAHEARIAAGALSAGVYAVVLELDGDGGTQRAVRQLTVAR